MYTLQVFRTESIDHNEAFSKMEGFVKYYNRNELNNGTQK